MTSFILRLDRHHLKHVYQFLEAQEPWSIIALDALLLYQFNHPFQHWFAEVKDGVLQGIIFQDNELLHFVYPETPSESSPLYPFIKSRLPLFRTYGQKELLISLLSCLLGRRVQPTEESIFVKQSSWTKTLLDRPIRSIPQLVIRWARTAEENNIFQLFEHSEVAAEFDRELVHELIWLNRVLVAEVDGELVGTVMSLKESLHFALLGGLYVVPSMREQRIAQVLGQSMMKQVIHSGKTVCFYYKEEEQLHHIYQKGLFNRVGTWASFSISVF